MPVHDFNSQRLFVENPLDAGVTLDLDRSQANYLLNVLRLKPGDTILIFNGRDGEWAAELDSSGRKKASLCPTRKTRPQPQPANLTYAFAPLKQARLSFPSESATERSPRRVGSSCAAPQIPKNND